MRFTRVGAFTAVMTTTLCVLVFTSCKADKTTPCGDQTCRSGYTCDTIHDECVVPAQLEECVGETDGSECAINGTYGYVCDQEVCLQSECGDGILDIHMGEECDDGNHVDDDECPNNCTLSCGDGTVNPGEDCDGNDLAGQTCNTLGFDSGQLTCELTCSFDASNCSIDCGNGEIHSTEGCDDDNTDAGDGCSDSCEVEFGWDCQGSPSVCERLPYVAMSGGGFHACAIRSDDTVWCWGANLNGQLGVSGAVSSSVPVHVAGLSGVVILEAGAGHTCVVKDDGTVWCWGINQFGQLGNGTSTDDTVANPTPTQVIGLTDVVALSAGGGHTCAITSDSTVWCWGLNDHGQLGDGNATHPATPPNPDAAQMPGFTGAASIAAGASHNCVIKGDGTTWCWGWNNQGQLGIGNTNNPVTAPQLVSLPSAEIIAAGFGHTCAVLTDGTARCWGWNEWGQVGVSDLLPRTTVPATISALSNVENIVTGLGHSCAQLSDGTVWCWGVNEVGQLGNGVMNVGATVSPVQVSGITDAMLTSSKGNHTCSLRPEGWAWCWGANSVGQLGDGTIVDKDVPVPVVLVP